MFCCRSFAQLTLTIAVDEECFERLTGSKDSVVPPMLDRFATLWSVDEQGNQVVSCFFPSRCVLIDVD